MTGCWGEGLSLEACGDGGLPADRNGKNDIIREDGAMLFPTYIRFIKNYNSFPKCNS